MIPGALLLLGRRGCELTTALRLETMACGLPIVAFDLPVYREFINDECGYFVSLKATHAMAERILFLLQNRDVRERMWAHNPEPFKPSNWDRTAQMEEQVLAKDAE